MSDQSVFISYRRDVSRFIARAVFQDLRHHGFDVFMDIESIDSGQFEQIILNQIAARPHFVVIIAPGSLDRCSDPGDWLRREMEYAMRMGRNVIPVLFSGFGLGDATPHLTGELATLTRYNALTVPDDYFEEAMARLRERFLKQPAAGTVQPTPTQDLDEVQRKIQAAEQEPQPTEEELTSESLLREANLHFNRDAFHEAIEKYNQALELDPDNPMLFFNRGLAFYSNLDPELAISDFDSAIELDPNLLEAHRRRAMAMFQLERFDEALTSCNRALELGDALRDYWNRAAIYYETGNFAAAAEDYSQIIDRTPDDAAAHNNRAECHLSLGRYRDAIADFHGALHLDLDEHAQVGLALALFKTGGTAETGRALEMWRAFMHNDNHDIFRYPDALARKFTWSDPIKAAAQEIIDAIMAD